MAKYSMETPAAFTDQLKMIHFDAELYEEPAHQATNILTPGSKYVVEVSMELGAKIKCLLCGEWCVSVAAETFGPGRDRRVTKTVPMNNCDPSPDKVRFDLPADWFDDKNDDACAELYSLAVTVVALDSCHHKPIGIAGFAKLGNVLTYA